MAGKGSKPGERRGGRKKGTPNKATTAAAIQAEIAASGELPLDFMLRVMRDETAEPARRAAMAKAAAPYVHARLAAVAHRHTNADGSPFGPTIINQYIEQRRPEAPAPAETGSGVSDRRH
jgi:hypothetical protein